MLPTWCNRYGQGIFNTLANSITRDYISKVEIKYKNKQGHMDVGHAGVLYGLVNIYAPSKVIEIGSLYGRSTSIILDASPNSTISCIDTFQYSVDGKATVDDYFDKFSSNTKEYKDRIKVYKSLSFNIHDSFKDNSIDLLFIDGDHSYDGVYKDIIYYHSKLKPGGIILGHDYPHPMVERFNFNGLMHCVNGLVRDRPDIFIDFGYFGGLWGARYKGTPLN